MNKKIIAVLLSLSMVVALSSCKNTKKGDSSAEKGQSAEEQKIMETLPDEYGQHDKETDYAHLEKIDLNKIFEGEKGEVGIYKYLKMDVISNTELIKPGKELMLDIAILNLGDKTVAIQGSMEIENELPPSIKVFFPGMSRVRDEKDPNAIPSNGVTTIPPGSNIIIHLKYVAPALTELPENYKNAFVDQGLEPEELKNAIKVGVSLSYSVDEDPIKAYDKAMQPEGKLISETIVRLPTKQEAQMMQDDENRGDKDHPDGKVWEGENSDGSGKNPDGQTSNPGGGSTSKPADETSKGKPESSTGGGKGEESSKDSGDGTLEDYYKRQDTSIEAPLER